MAFTREEVEAFRRACALAKQAKALLEPIQIPMAAEKEAAARSALRAAVSHLAKYGTPPSITKR